MYEGDFVDGKKEGYGKYIEENNAIYDLYGIIEHFGTMSSGHYTAICKNNNKWINYNDSSLDINKNPVSKNAYVLFYKKQNNEKKNCC